MRARLQPAAVAAVLLAAAVASPADAPGGVIVHRPDRTGLAGLVGALEKALQAGAAPARLVALSGDLIADSARLAHDAQGTSTIYAVGPDATDAAGTLSGPSVVSLAVPNPARLRTAGTYLSIYPRLERVFAYLRDTLKAKSIGLAFSPAQNREVAIEFLGKAGEQGLAVTSVSIASSGDLVRELPKALGKIDVLVLAVDPIIFERQNLKYIVEKATEAKKPTVGFLEELPRLGVTVALVPPPAEVASLATQLATLQVKVGKKRVEVDRLTAIVSKEAAAAVGLDPGGLGAP